MSEPFTFDVFFSFSPADQELVRPIAERLRKDGLLVWFGDSEAPDRTEAALEHSRALVLCMSANAFGADWPRLESTTFRFRDPLNKHRRFIPLRLDDAPFRGSLAQSVYVDWRKGDYEKLLEACRKTEKEVTPEQQASSDRLQARIISLGHTERVRSVAFSPDGRRALLRFL